MSSLPDDTQDMVETPRPYSVTGDEGLNENDQWPPTPSLVRPTTAEWQFESILGVSPNFKPVPRVSASESTEVISKAIADYEHKGIPLILEGWHLKAGWKSEIHTPRWLAERFKDRK